MKMSMCMSVVIELTAASEPSAAALAAAVETAIETAASGTADVKAFASEIREL